MKKAPIERLPDKRVARRHDQKAHAQRPGRQLHENAHHDQEPAQPARGIHLVFQEEGDETALVSRLGEGAHEIGIGDGVDEAARRGGDFVGEGFRQPHAAPRQRHDDAEIERRPDGEDQRVRRMRLEHQDAADEHEDGHAHHVEAEDVQDGDGRLSRLLHLLAELAGEILLKIAGSNRVCVGSCMR